ncbi:phage major capsid protein [Pseudonocardia alni]|uniref:phage major capsid protein n=1 Tax=Pseudonocardia alni TaxID=33907 RepID=UPI003326DD23
MAVATESLAEEMRAHLKSARDISDAVDKENRDFNDTERSQLNELLGKASELKNRIKQQKGDSAVRAAIADLGDGIQVEEKSGPRRTPTGLIVPKRGGKSVGQLYIEGDEYRDLLGQAPSGQFQKNHRVSTRPTGFETLTPNRGQKGLITGASDTSAGAFLRGDDLGLRVGLEPFQRPLTLRDLVTSGTTQSDAIEYVRVTSITNNAAPVAEATSSAIGAATGPGGYKPESGLATQRVGTTIKTIAHWIPITKRALADAAQMVTLIDAFLEYGLEEELEDQMIAGDGTGENFEGLSNVSGVQAQGYVDNHLVTTRKAKTKVRVNGRSQPNGFVINPADLETIELLREDTGAGAGTGQFFFGGPAAAGGAPTLWGLPVVESEAVPAGTAYVGDWRKAVLWDRQQSTITTTDSHADFFVRNLVAILAEMRAGFGVLQPSAFVEIDLTEPVTP